MCEMKLWECRDQYAGEPEEASRRKSLQIVPTDSSPTASPPHSSSAADLVDNNELKRNGMRITFKASLPHGCSLPPSKEADVLLVKQPLPMWMELSARDKHTLR